MTEMANRTYVCFKCRFTARAAIRGKSRRPHCTNCGEPTEIMPADTLIPKKRDKRGWRVLQDIWETECKGKRAYR